MLDDLKLLLGIAKDDTDRDALLKKLISMAMARLTLLLGGIDPPGEMDHIILDVTVARFNRIGSEGLSSHAVEGETLQFVDDDFAQFRDEIQDWMNRQTETIKGRLRFL